MSEAASGKTDNLVEGLVEEVTGWRRHLHANPELSFQESETAAYVAQNLRAFGFDEVHEGIAKTGVVGVLHGRNGPGGRGIGVRADMDALPIEEITGAQYTSTRQGVMHACGHDGHTALLLGAAKALAQTRSFDGTAYFIFQPAEEFGGGGEKMIEDGLFERFEMDEVYGLHNGPGVDVGKFEIRPGAIMASADELVIRIASGGGHAAMPHQTVDTVLVGAHIIVALQALVSRETDALGSAVISITQLSGSQASNIIPAEVVLGGTVRTLDAGVRDRMEARITQVAQGIATAMGATATLTYERGYPPTVNHAKQTAFAAEAARAVAGHYNVNDQCQPVMGAEDFAYMLEEKPGAYIVLGNGDGPVCHMPDYDFNDDAIPFGVRYWIELIERALPAE